MRSRPGRPAPIALLLVLGLAAVAACGHRSTGGGDTPAGDGGDEGGEADAEAGASDEAASDAGVPPTGDEPADSLEDAQDAPSATDATLDAAPDRANPSDGATNNCAINGKSCGDPGGTGVCKGSTCSPCVDGDDDALCTAAYGSSASLYLCLAGYCVPGDCRTDSDCAANANGPLCGVRSPHACGRCTDDTQCATRSIITPICDTAAGACVGGTCAVTASGAAGTCPVNPEDGCCGGLCSAPGGTGACCPGAAGTAFCQGLDASSDCINGVCTSCPATTNGQYLVDPVRGSDATGTGATAAGCAFKTITRALAVIGASAALINVAGPSVIAAGEVFPIVVPANVSLFATGGTVTVQVPAGAAGFILNGGNSSLQDGFVVDGQSGGGTYGIVATVGSTFSTRIDTITVKGFAFDGILVQAGGALALGNAIQVTGNGLVTGRHAGMRVAGRATATPLTTASSSFFRNAIGVVVEGAGSVSLTGTPVTDPPTGAGSLTVGGNAVEGLRFDPGGAMPSASVVTGVVAYANQGSGFHLFAGARVSLRGNVSMANSGSGVLVSSALGPGPDDLHLIDLGDLATTAGDNDLQEPPGASRNGAAGICLAVRPDSGTLLAEGNDLVALSPEGGTSVVRAACATGPGLATAVVGGCANAPSCTSGVCDVGVVNSGNAVDVAACTLP